MPINKIDFFQPAIWQQGALLKEVERCLSVADDDYASGRWRAAVKPQVLARVRQTLRGKPVKSFDPAGFLGELGLETSLAAGRTNRQMIQAFHLIKDYQPDIRYFPFSKKLGIPVQKFFLTASRFAPGPVTTIDRFLDPLAVRWTEKIHNTERYHTHPYGRFEEVIRGQSSDLSKEACYPGILRNQMRQYAWDRGPHAGSIDSRRRADENFGTYDIAVGLGFSEQQARRMAIQCYGVDISQTHYRDPMDPAKARTTGTVGEIGDIQRHYNRSPEGVEDTRITAARVHLRRAHRLVDEGFYDAGEEELAIGLHSLQDIFSHAQLTPSTHTCLGEFPDLVRYHPQAMFETALATEGYFKKFITGLGLKPPQPSSEPGIPFAPSDAFIGGPAGPDEQAHVSQILDTFPNELIAFLKDNGIRFFAGTPETLPTALGFGIDAHEDDEDWNRQKAAYNHYNRIVFLSAPVFNDPELETILKHEIKHAVDCCLQDDPNLGPKWKAYIEKLYNSARRRGEIAFDEMDGHEYFAQ